MQGLTDRIPLIKSLLGNLTTSIPSMAQVPAATINRPTPSGGTGTSSETVTNNVTVNSADNPDLWLRAVQRELDGDV